MNTSHKSHSQTKHHAGFKLVRIWHKLVRERLLTLLLAMQILIIFVLPPARAAGLPITHNAIYAILLVFIATAIIVARSRVAIIMMIISVLLTIAGIILRQNQPDLLADSISATGQVLTQFSLLWIVTTAVFGPGRITYHRIMGALVIYLGIGMIFTSIDILLARTVANAFTNLPPNSIDLRDAMTYLSFSTLTTSSFGDIMPLHPIARSLANVESICGQLFPATLLARIVLKHGASNDD